MKELEQNKKTWETHYNRSVSKLDYPDENLVRILAKIDSPSKKALDFGAGSGRHCKLLSDFGYSVVASDIAENSLESVKKLYPNILTKLVIGPDLPFSNQSFGLILAWGVLHYNQKEAAKHLLNQLYSFLEPGGYLVGSIRAESDSHLALNDGEIGLADLKGGYAVTYSKLELESLLSPFSTVQIGYSERSPLGDLAKRICHYFFLAKK